jgi:uncharacterized membrane protein YdjX (TVP38/TMEM64 family)
MQIRHHGSVVFHKYIGQFMPRFVLLESINKKSGLRRYIGPKRIILVVTFIAFVFWAWDYYSLGLLSPEMIEQYRNDHPVGAVLLFVLVYAISVIASVPSLPLNLAAGFFWGGFWGGFYSTIGVTIGGWISFVAARWLIGQPLAEQFDNKWASKVQREFDRSGWKFVAFARINPIIPTGPLNYLLGLTSLSNRDFLWATFIFLLPPSIAVAYIGDTLQTFTAQQSGVNEMVRGILIASAALTFLVGVKFAFRIFKKRKDKL